MSQERTKKRHHKPGVNEAALRAAEVEAINLKIAGLTLVQIAERQGVDPSAVSKRISRGLDRATIASAKTMRQLEGARLDEVHARLTLIMRSTDATAKDRIAAARGIAYVTAQKAKLFGYAAPERVEIDFVADRVLEAVRKAVSEEDFERIAELVAAAAGEGPPREEPRGEAAPGSPGLPN